MKKIILIFIFLLALFLRTYKLGQYPLGFLWDEAALGYNAFSVLKTGRDEYGKLLPVIFKSFGDYKPGLYVYLTIPGIFLLGLNEFAVRLPSAIFGTLTVILIYFLVKEGLEPKQKSENDNIAIFSSLILTVSPWHINFSRGAWELNVMLFEIVLGLYLLMRFLRIRKNKFLFGSAVVFVLSLFTYQAAKMLLPVLLAGFIFFFRHEVKAVPKKQKVFFISVVLGGFLLFNLATILGGGTGRLKVMSIFSYPRSFRETQMVLGQDNNDKLDFSIFHSSPIFFTRSILGRYFNHFSGKFLFFSGDWSNSRNGTVYQGVLYLADLVFLIFGLAFAFSSKRKPLKNLMIYWLIIAPLPSALTRDSISAVRSFSMVIPLTFFVSVGISRFLDFAKKQKKLIRFLFYSATLIIYFFLLIRFLDFYFVHDKIFNSESRLYGYKEMINFVSSLTKSKDKVVITNYYGQPYIFYLFYTRYDSAQYQKQAVLKENIYGDVGEVKRIDNIEFTKIYWPDIRGYPNLLFVGNEFELPLQDIVGQEKIALLKQIDFLNRKPAFRIVETK